MSVIRFHLLKLNGIRYAHLSHPGENWLRNLMHCSWDMIISAIPTSMTDGSESTGMMTIGSAEEHMGRESTGTSSDA